MEHASCYTPQCTRREHCTLWHNALVEVEYGNSLLTITNPQLIDKAGGYDHCPNYHEHKLRRYARGLVWRYHDLTQGFIAETFATYAPAVEPRYQTYEEHYVKPPRIEGRAAHKLLKG